MDGKAELKDRLRMALELREKKAVDLARDLKIPKSALSQYLSGYRTIKDSKRLYIIAEYLDVSEAWLMGFDVPMERHLANIEEKPVETANKLADMFLHQFEIKETDAEVKLMLEEYYQLSERSKDQIRGFVHFLLEQEGQG